MRNYISLLVAALLLLLTGIAASQPPEFYGYPGYERPGLPPSMNYRGGGGGIQIEKTQDEQGYQLLIRTNGNVDPESVQVTVQGSTLLIERQQSTQREERSDEGRYFSFSRSSNSFHRRMTLPRDADVAGMQRTTENGTIRITFPYLGR